MHRPTAIELLEAHHPFPSDHVFRAIVRSEPADVDHVLASVAGFCGLPDLTDRVERVPSSGGRWVSLRLSLPCPTAARVLEIYAHLQALPQVVRCLQPPESRTLVRAWADPVGTAASLGPYAVGAELIFGIDVQDTNQHWQSGPSSRNGDGVTHVAVTFEGSCSWLVGFEDLTGGGDRDYDDVVLRVQGLLRQEE